MAAPDVEMWRLDCGEFKDVNIKYMSDVFAYPDKNKILSNGCYLIRHEKQFMLWDTGFSPASLGKYKSMVEMSRTLLVQLQKIDVQPEQISIIGLSHHDFDHTGQAANFPKARLFMGKADFDHLAAGEQELAASEDIAPWLGSGANAEAVVGDKDIFGDGSVLMLATPGHTEGHHSLLVRLPTFGPVVLSGDLWHFSEQLSHNGMPSRNVDRADTLASMDRVQKIIGNLKATLVIQHEAADVEKLPVFPASAH
jgi:N-acyl homoserine lactone hydrolase